MKVKVRGGYVVNINGVEYTGKQVIDIDEKDYTARHWVFEQIKEEAPVVKGASSTGVAEIVIEEDVNNRMMESPIQTKVRRRKNAVSPNS
jgi:hypothetical protein